MTTEPYTPDEAELIESYAGVVNEYDGENYDKAEADAERGIAKVKADALREAASEALVHDQSSWLRYVKETDRAIIEQWLVTLAERIEGAEA